MNGQTREIAEYLGCSMEEALRVQNAIDKLALLDWSECTRREFGKAVREARDYLVVEATCEKVKAHMAAKALREKPC